MRLARRIRHLLRRPQGRRWHTADPIYGQALVLRELLR